MIGKQKILIISYFFPPLGKGGVQRVLKFTKYLPSFDWHPTVITVKNDIGNYPLDYSLENDVPPDVKVHRTKAYSLYRFISRIPFLWRIAVFFEQVLNFPDPFFGWAISATIKSLILLKREEYDIVLISVPPHSHCLIGIFLKIFSKISVVLDVRDLWTQDARYLCKHPIKKKLERMLEKFCYKIVDKIIVVTPEFKNYIKEGFKIEDKKLICITNGYDEDDFQIINKPSEESQFIIGYVGNLHASQFYTPEPFFKAMSKLFSQYNQLKKKIKIRIYGVTNFLDLIKKYELTENVFEFGYLKHKEAIQKGIQCHLMLLINFLVGRDGYCIPGKTYEYLRMGNYILGMTKEGKIADILRKSELGFIHNPQDIDGMAKTIYQLYQLWKENQLCPKPNMKYIERFERRNLTKQLVDLLN